VKRSCVVVAGVLGVVGIGCGGTCPAPASAPASAPAPAPAPAPDADLTLLLRPSSSPPLVHVEVSLPHSKQGSSPDTWTIAAGAADRITHTTAHDSNGDLGVRVSQVGMGVELRLDRSHIGPVTLAYDVLPGDDAPDDPRGLLVLDDRFRGAGEKLVALPSGAEDLPCNAIVAIDGDALRASGAASSAGVGASRKASMRAGALRGMTFVAGSLGVQVIDDPAAGHDEGAWLGYTAFDPRPIVAELSQIRSSLHELLRSQSERGSWTYLVVSQTRPLGSFTSTPRARSTLLQVGPGEPWSAGLRLSMAQQLARRWIGGELALEADPPAAGAWFGEGVSRYVAMVLLARLGLMTPDEVRDAVSGELSVLATSPVRTLDNAQLAKHPGEAERATLMARGALYALHESARIHVKTKGQHGVVDVLSALVRQAEDHKLPPFTPAAWVAAVGAEDPDAQRTFDALVVRGEPDVLPKDALGPCFQAGMGEYVAFDPGFDLETTRTSREGKVASVRPGGPADKAGLKDGDVVESLVAHEGDSSVPVKLVVTRAGAKIPVSYLPRGAHGRGQTWTRLKMPDERCGDPP
jgi:hypothetical protein